MKKVQLVIITCCLAGSVYSASLFGVDFTAPDRVAKTGIGEISQVIKPQRKQHSNFPIGGNNPFSNGNFDSDKNEDSINPVSGGIFERIKPHQSAKINKSNPENNKFSDSRVTFKDDQGPDSEKVHESISQKSNLNTDSDVSKQESNNDTSGLKETGPDDYTTETLEYEVKQ